MITPSAGSICDTPARSGASIYGATPRECLARFNEAAKARRQALAGDSLPVRP
jgi:hypothetical protein